ncbi:hypothetical protein FOMPIDRAFT_1046829 [Fomitopsis schrenkii]|uniref:Uncharacterized protein n=1 Tax=Fomitopsis schrenkii TaxID=2126942 RepID=S8EKG0_FOMSC|nr:hypothetical protein FOMPIDRAFT_1046829 [Fomitopsis schrenkii]
MATVTISSRSAALAAAAESRLPANKPASAGVLYKNYDEGHTRRQELRKMIDRGILERNALEVALRALKTMKRIAENIVKDPKNNDYKQIKRHGKTFMRNVVEPKGALDFLVEASIARPFLPSISIFSLGFREKAIDYNTLLVFHQKYITDLKLGLTLLNEAIEREEPKREREERAIELAKAEEIAAKEKAMKHFMDDRKTVQQRVVRETVGHARRQGSVPPPAPTTHGVCVQPFNGTGHTLGSV